MLSITKDFASVEGIDLEVYAGVDNMILIKITDEDGQLIAPVGGSFEAKVKRQRGGSPPTLAVFTATYSEIQQAMQLEMSAAESKKLITKQQDDDFIYFYDLVWLLNDKRIGLCYGKVIVKAGVTI